MLKEYKNMPNVNIKMQVTGWYVKTIHSNVQETAKSLQNGWFYTGDKGYYDKDGNVFVIGRYKELIKYRMAHVIISTAQYFFSWSINVHILKVVPTNIEKHMLTHPAIEDCGVVGLPHDVHGELPFAFVVQRPGVDVTAEDIIQYTNGN